MQKWEYKTLWLKLWETKGHEEQLNKLGNDGWELVNIAVHKSKYCAFFKRQA